MFVIDGDNLQVSQEKDAIKWQRSLKYSSVVASSNYAIVCCMLQWMSNITYRSATDTFR